MDAAQRYDHIVVGAGAAGCVLAGRLAATGRTVLLLEAGSRHPTSTSPNGHGDDDDDGDDGDGPSFFDALDQPGRTLAGFAVQWTDHAPAKPYRLGRGLGGGSAVNAMIATTGSPEDYDHWERDLGCEGWGWSSLRSVLGRVRLPLERTAPSEWGDVDRALVAAAEEFGHATSSDRGQLHHAVPDTWRRGGGEVGSAELTRRGGRRISAARAYLVDAGENLTVRTDALVDKIMIDGTTAVGVMTADGRVFEAAEVIVSAGAIHSPAILLRSGVERAAIGAGLKDHASARLSMRLRTPGDPDGLAAATLLRWSSRGGAHDLQLLPLNHFGRAADPAMGGLVAAVMSARSSGSVTLASDDPAVQPTVRFGLLDDELDRRRLREAARHMAELATSPSFAAIVSDVFVDDHGTHLEAFADHLADDADLDTWLIANVGDYFHAACTCRMGLRHDESTVVDTAGRVHGYERLRVCDASIFPELPRANPYLPTVMVAEQISAMIEAGR